MEIMIQQEDGEKGRAMHGHVLAYITADGVNGGNTENLRPVFACVASSEAQIRPLIANLRMGKKAVFLHDNPTSREGKLEFLKSFKIGCSYQRCPSGVVATLVAPDVFTRNPGMVDPSGINFILAPESSVLQGLKWDRKLAMDAVQAFFNHLCGIEKNRQAEFDREFNEKYGYGSSRAWVAPDFHHEFMEYLDHTPLFAAYLDSRTRCPLIDDLRFMAVLLYRCMDLKLCGGAMGRNRWEDDRKWGKLRSMTSQGLEMIHLAPALGMFTSHNDFETVLKEVSVWYLTQYQGQENKVDQTSVLG